MGVLWPDGIGTSGRVQLGTPVWVTVLLAVLTFIGTITTALIGRGYFDLKTRLQSTTSDLKDARQQLDTVQTNRPCPPSGEKVDKPSQPALLSQSVGDLKVDLEKCTTQDSKSVTCTFGLTNLKPDRRVGIISTGYGQSSYYVDNHGMQRLAESVTFGGIQGGLMMDAVTDVRIPGSLTFPGAEAGVASLAKVSIWINLPEYVHYTADFRNVPLQ